MTQFRGLFPPLITTFDEAGRFDASRMKSHVDFMIEGGCDGLIPCGSTGEFVNLTRQEWEQVLGTVYEHVNGRVPLIAGAAAHSTVETIDRCRFAEKMGYQGIMVISPWYQVLTEREVYAHFKAVRSAISAPIMIYNNPPVTGIQLKAPLLERLAKDGIIQYLKDADGDPYTISRLKLSIGDKLSLFYGHDNNAVGAFAVGATGWVSGAANFDPARWSRLIHLCIDDQDFEKARELWYQILPFIILLTVGKNNERPNWIAVIKRALELRGREVGSVRPPMLPLTAEEDAELAQVVQNMKFE